MFNKSISVLGSKGGVGKTTSAHMLAYGLATFGVAPILITSDAQNGRVSLNDENRPYQCVAGQTGETLNNIFAVFNSLPVEEDSPKVLIVDGGGNRNDIDDLFVQATDLALLPFRRGDEDFRVVSADLNRHSTALGLPTNWISNPFAQAANNHSLARIAEAFPGRIMKPVPLITSSEQLLKEEMGPVDTKLRSVCRALAVDVMQRLDINLHQL